MYHISSDPRAKASAQRICDALMECARRKPFSEISVTDLYKEHRVSRTTFYRLFDNTVDVLEYACDQMGQTILLTIRGDTSPKLTIQAITALTSQRELINLLCQSGHLDIFQRVQEKYLPFSQLADGLDLDYGSEYFHRILAQMIPLAMDVWLSGGQQDTPEEVYNKLCHSIRMLGMWFS